MRSSRGFTLIELMIVVAIVAIVASISVPNLLAARLAANETSAMSCLRSIASAQGQFQISGRVDVDHDGAGEYGLLRELSGAVGIRRDATAATAGRVLVPAYLSGAFRILKAPGEVIRAGYHYRMFLPTANGRGVGEPAAGPLASPLDLDEAEAHWTCYAWPSYKGVTGLRAFVITQHGDLAGTPDGAYTAGGAIQTANCGVAFLPGGPIDGITGMVAMGTRGRDGSMWKTAR